MNFSCDELTRKLSGRRAERKHVWIQIAGKTAPAGNTYPQYRENQAGADYPDLRDTYFSRAAFIFSCNGNKL
jgi:hypothetical protein